MNIEEHANRLLDRVGVLRHPSDLDLLIFFARHPHSLLPSEYLATLLGYSLQEIAASLDRLVDAGLVTRAQSLRHAARMYVFAERGTDRGWLAELLAMASTRDGRLAMRSRLQRGVTDAGADVVQRERAIEPGRPFLVQPSLAASARSKAR